MQRLTIESAKELLHQHVQNINLRRHCYAVGIALRAYFMYYQNQNINTGDLSADDWEIVGILHDSDWEKTTNTPEHHTVMLLEWLKNYEASEELLNVFKSHNNHYTNLRNPETLLEWTLECCDELTGFIVAVTLVRPDKKLAEVQLESVLKKFKQKEFSRAVNREQISQCQEKLAIPLEKFIDISLSAMKTNAEILDL